MSSLWPCMNQFCMIVQVYWLLSAISQDQPKNKAVGELRDMCERAALEGSWVSQAWPSVSIYFASSAGVNYCSLSYCCCHKYGNPLVWQSISMAIQVKHAASSCSQCLIGLHTSVSSVQDLGSGQNSKYCTMHSAKMQQKSQSALLLTCCY